MFESIDDIAADLRQFDESGWRAGLRAHPLTTDIGRAILQIASGKSVNGHLPAEQSAVLAPLARRVISDVMLRRGGTHFTVLGLDPTATPADIRDHFRRLMALVHPDTNPVGFPSDAAARVNRAYGVLSNDDERIAYCESLLAGSVVAADENAVGRRTMANDDLLPERRGGVLQGLFATLRSRHALPWLALLLVLPALIIAWSILGQSEPVKLVDASQRAATARVQPGEAVSAASTQFAATPGTSAPTTATAPAAQESAAPPASATRAPDGAGSLHLSLVDALSDRSIELAATRRPKPAGAAQGRPGVNTASGSLAPSPGAAYGAPVPPEPTALAQQPADPAQSSTETAAAVAQPPATAGPPARQAAAPASVQEPLRARDVEDALLRFVSAYETGSMSGFSQLLSPRMNGRRQMLSEYERVFSSTRQRHIKLNQLKHNTQGDRISSTGYATVTTVDHDNRTAVQRVFIEFEFARDGGQTRIERLANYAVN